MLRYLRKTFFEPRGREWFGLGLIIESASKPVADPVFARLRDALPYVTFDLLSKDERPELPGFRYSFRVKRALGGLRLLWHARKHYDLVVFFVTGEPQLRLCRAFALAVMRPRRFFVFNEFGQGFWLDREHWPELQTHVVMRYDLETRRQRLLEMWTESKRRWRGRLLRLAAAAARTRRAFTQGLVSAVLLCYAAIFLLPALAMLALLRLTYDSSEHRFRIFGKTMAAPRRRLADAAEAPASCAIVKK